MTQLCDKCKKEAAVWAATVEPLWAAEVWNVYALYLCDSCAKPVIELLEEKS